MTVIFGGAFQWQIQSLGQSGQIFIGLFAVGKRIVRGTPHFRIGDIDGHKAVFFICIAVIKLKLPVQQFSLIQLGKKKRGGAPFQRKAIVFFYHVPDKAFGNVVHHHGLELGAFKISCHTQGGQILQIVYPGIDGSEAAVGILLPVGVFSLADVDPAVAGSKNGIHSGLPFFLGTVRKIQDIVCAAVQQIALGVIQ